MSLNDRIIQAPKLYYYNVHNVSIKELYVHSKHCGALAKLYC